jgi:hypothetical protein
MFTVLATVIVLGIRRFAKHEFSTRGAVVGGLAAFVYVVAQKLLGLEASMTEGYDTTQPLVQQYLRDALLTLVLAATATLLVAMSAGVGVRHASRSAAGFPRFSAWRDAGALAFLMLGAGTFLRWLAPSAGPRIPAVRDADKWSPVLDALFDGADFVMLCAAVVTAIAVLCARSGWRAWMTAGLFALSGVVLGARSPDFTLSSIVAAVVVGIASGWLFRRYVLFRVELVAPLLVWLTLLGNLQNAVRPAFPGALAASIVGILSVLGGYFLWQWLVRKDSPASSSSPPAAQAPS